MFPEAIYNGHAFSPTGIPGSIKRLPNRLLAGDIKMILTSQSEERDSSCNAAHTF